MQLPYQLALIVQSNLMLLIIKASLLYFLEKESLLKPLVGYAFINFHFTL